jgi:hypothetical protein
MDYVATEFLTLADRPADTADLVRALVGSDAAWEQLVTQHDDRAAALLAVCGALSRLSRSSAPATSQALCHSDSSCHRWVLIRHLEL